jgi:hypothetical protein
MKPPKPKFEDVIKKVDFLQTGHRGILRQLTRGYYDIQKLRIAVGNRLCANFYVKIGVDPKSKTETAPGWGKEILKYYIVEYTRLADFVSENHRNLKKVLDDYCGVIGSKAEYAMVQTYINFVKQETFLEKQMGDYLDFFPIWTQFLKGIDGVGPLMGCVIISEYDIYKARYVSSMWKYAGLDVFEGEGRSRKAHHLVDVHYIDREGKEKVKKGISFNPFLKTKLLGVLAPGIIKQHGRKPNKYGQIYYDYKERLIRRRDINIMKYSKNLSAFEAEKAARKEWPDGRIHNAAMRYIIKMLIQDLYPIWKEIEGLPAMPPYPEAKLGMDLSHHDNELEYGGGTAARVTV